MGQFTGYDPLAVIDLIWPDVRLYDKQREFIYSLCSCRETYVPSAKKMGKDFSLALGCWVFYLTREPAVVITTSVDEGQLETVLWGEIANFYNTAKYKLPVLFQHLEVRRLDPNGREKKKGKDYFIGRVAKVLESFSGHHLPYWGENNDLPSTMMAYDEVSGINPEFKRMTDGWAHNTVIVGNPNKCDANHFFKIGVKGGIKYEIADPSKIRNNIIKIKAEHSPNVRLGLAQKRNGKKPTNEIVCPGVLTYFEYLDRRAHWDAEEQCIGLDAEFYEGREIMLYPVDWLNRAEEIATTLDPYRKSNKIGMGVDTAEGGNKTAWSIVDEFGLKYQIARPTPDTSEIPDETLALMHMWGVPAEFVCFDGTGGGGVEHADVLRRRGYNVRTVAFGESVKNQHRFRRHKSGFDRRKQEETRYLYKNRRAEMYGMLRVKMDPHLNKLGFALPAEYAECRRQLSLIPRLLDEEGRLFLPKKRRTVAVSETGAKRQPTLIEIMGCSPDEADSLVMANWVMDKSEEPAGAGVY